MLQQKFSTSCVKMKFISAKNERETIEECRFAIMKSEMTTCMYIVSLLCSGEEIRYKRVEE